MKKIDILFCEHYKDSDSYNDTSGLGEQFETVLSDAAQKVEPLLSKIGREADYERIITGAMSDIEALAFRAGILYASDLLMNRLELLQHKAAPSHQGFVRRF